MSVELLREQRTAAMAAWERATDHDEWLAARSRYYELDKQIKEATCPKSTR